MTTARRFSASFGLWGLTFVASLIIAIVPLEGRAQDDQAPVIAVINMQRILRESTAVRSLQQQLDEQRSAYQGEIRQKEEGLRASEQELARQRSVLSAEAFATKRRELQQQVTTLQREIQERKRRLDKGFSDGMSEVQQALVTIVTEIATDNNVDIVLAKASVVLVRPEMEITEEALSRLNDELPSLRLAVDGG